MQNNLKVIIMDGDGSTITRENLVPDSLRELISAHSTIKWVMATGRSLDLLKMTPIMDCLSTDVPHILDGGGRLMYLNGSTEIAHFISEADIALFFKMVQPNLINFIYYSPDGKQGYAYVGDSLLPGLPGSFKLKPSGVIFTHDISEFAHWTSMMPASKLLINSAHTLNLEGLYWHRNEMNIDITAKGIDKGTTCVELLKKLGVSPEEAAFVFNDRNDLPIVNNEHLHGLITIKVGDALPHVKSCYEIATPHELASILADLLPD